MTKKEGIRAVAGKQTRPHGNPFRSIAEIYDAMSLLTSFGLIRTWRKRVARKLTVGAGEVALDLGTGTADFAIELARVSAAGARIIGIDLTPEMLAQAQRKVCLSGLETRIELRLGNGEHLDLPDNSVDLCCSSFFVRTLTDLELGLREMRRVVRPGGQLVCLEVSHPPGPILRALPYLLLHLRTALWRLARPEAQRLPVLPPIVARLSRRSPTQDTHGEMWLAGCPLSLSDRWCRSSA